MDNWWRITDGGGVQRHLSLKEKQSMSRFEAETRINATERFGTPLKIAAVFRELEIKRDSLRGRGAGFYYSFTEQELTYLLSSVGFV